MSIRGRLGTGALLIVVGMLTFASPAGAAEIPPTAECVQTAREVIREHSQAGDSEAAQRRAERRSIMKLFRADCVSDPGPLLKQMKPKPFTAECRKAATAADRFWGPLTRQYRALARKFNKRLKPLRKQTTRLRQRIHQLRRQGASKARIKPVLRRQRALVRKRQRLSDQMSRRAFRLARPQAYDTYLVLSELVSLRCLDLDSAIEGKPVGPAARIAHKHVRVVVYSIIAILLEEMKAQDEGAPRPRSAGGPLNLQRGNPPGLSPDQSDDLSSSSRT